MTALVYAFTLLLTASNARFDSRVPATRLAHLQTGTNVCLWFRGRPRNDDGYASYVTDAEMDTMRRMGLRHVRLCIAPRTVMDPTTGVPKEKEFGFVENAISRFLSHGLAVVVDMHNENRRDEADPAWQDRFNTFWKEAAHRLSTTDPERVFLEIVNEPVFEGHPQDWFPIQQRLAATIREQAPKHTIVATGPNWSNINGGLLLLTPLADRNVVYTFHCYDPHTFTHQGAMWSARAEHPLRKVPYPSTPELIAPLLDGLPEDAKSALKSYGDDRWDRRKMVENFQQAIDWGKRYRVPLYCGEFGVYPMYSLPEHRANWFRDFGGVLRQFHIGWSSWGWDDAFGLNRKKDGDKLTVDPIVVKSLGLKPP
ncbi:MAG: cellulase family glycosylhydrolase [Fimbriimonas sp.]|nr:cellulase family glycosylhydrolase [Fimbriimonas sp.]